MEKAGTSFIWRSLTYTSTMPNNFALRLILDCLNAWQLKLGSRAEKEWSLDNPILIREQNYLAWLMCGQTTLNKTY